MATIQGIRPIDGRLVLRTEVSNSDSSHSSTRRATPVLRATLQMKRKPAVRPAPPRVCCAPLLGAVLPRSSALPAHALCTRRILLLRVPLPAGVWVRQGSFSPPARQAYVWNVALPMMVTPAMPHGPLEPCTVHLGRCGDCTLDPLRR